MSSAHTDKLIGKRDRVGANWTAREKYLLDELIATAARIDALLSRVDSLEDAERERQAAMGRD